MVERFSKTAACSVVHDTFFRDAAERIDRGEFTPKESSGRTTEDSTNGNTVRGCCLFRRD
jgi:hypothetical protein